MSKTIIKALAGIGIVSGLGIAALPLTTYAANVPVSFTVKPTLISGSNICASAAAAGVNANTVQTVACTVTYSANGGASVSIKDSDSTLTLTGSVAGTSIPAATGTLTAGTPGWGYKYAVTEDGTAASSGGLTATAAGANYVAITAAAVTVGSNTVPVSSAASTFTFGMASSNATVAGTYTDTVVIEVTPAAV